MGESVAARVEQLQLRRSEDDWQKRRDGNDEQESDEGVAQNTTQSLNQSK